MGKAIIIRETLPFEHYEILWKTNNRYFRLVRDRIGHILLNTTRISKRAFDRLVEEYNNKEEK